MILANVRRYWLTVSAALCVVFGAVGCGKTTDPANLEDVASVVFNAIAEGNEKEAEVFVHPEEHESFQRDYNKLKAREEKVGYTMIPKNPKLDVMEDGDSGRVCLDVKNLNTKAVKNRCFSFEKADGKWWFVK